MSESAVKPQKNEVKIRISDGDLDAARRLASRKNIAVAEVISSAVERGLPQLIEDDNKMNWWVENSAKPELKRLIDSIPEDKREEAIAYLKKLAK